MEFKNITGTRKHIMNLLRKRQYTVEELAKKIGITRNAIRTQIVLLQRDGIVEPRGEIKGMRRPSLTYGLSVNADLLFSKAYPPVLANLLDVLAERMSQGELRTVMKKLGQKLAINLKPHPTGNLQHRIDGAIKVYETLGGLCEIEEKGGKLIIKGDGCPLAEAVKADASICIAIESLLSELIGVPVLQRCNPRDRPSCRFEVKISPQAMKALHQ
ncbi:MAG: helix-turn-helix transcriptional regulator [Syntrophales bacterium]